MAYTKMSSYPVAKGEVTYRLVEEHAGNEVVHDLADFGVRLDVVGVRLDEFFFAHAEVGQHFVVKVDSFVHL